MKYAILIIAVLLTACTVNKKYVEITVEDGTLTVQGNVDPQFMRENTSESQENTPTVAPTIDIKPLECDSCHAAHAGELFGEWRKKLDPPVIPEPDKPADEPVPPVEPEPPVIKTSTHFHHYNPRAVWNGVALVLCPDSPRYESCRLNGEPLTLHGSRDKGRDVWAWYSKGAGTGGTIICDGTRFEVRGGTNMQYGDCR